MCKIPSLKFIEDDKTGRFYIQSGDQVNASRSISDSVAAKRRLKAAGRKVQRRRVETTLRPLRLNLFSTNNIANWKALSYSRRRSNERRARATKDYASTASTESAGGEDTPIPLSELRGRPPV
jgi:hypothetical protein